MPLIVSALKYLDIQNKHSRKRQHKKKSTDTKIKNSRREVTAYELRFDCKRREELFPCAFLFFIGYRNNFESDLHKLKN